MAYATTLDMIDRYGEDELVQLTDRLDAPLREIDQVVLSRALSDADALIDTYLGRYLPLAAVPPALTQHACAIARKRLYKDAVPEVVKDDFETAVRFLEQVAAGRIQIVAAGEQAAPVSGGPGYHSGGSVFGNGALDGF